MENAILIQRLSQAHPGWDVWDQLIALVKSLDFQAIASEFLGNFYVAGSRLTFSDLPTDFIFPAWLPAYAPALYGMKADEWEMSGGYAGSFTGTPARKGQVFSPAGNDQELGYPIFDVPIDVYPFQSNSSGASFFINSQLQVLYPNQNTKRFEVLDPLPDFTQKNIVQSLAGRLWFSAYSDLVEDLLD